jgi:hypothetical protein
MPPTVAKTTDAEVKGSGIAECLRRPGNVVPISFDAVRERVRRFKPD